MSQEDYGMGGSIVSHKEKQRNDDEAKEEEKRLQNKKKKPKRKNKQHNTISINNMNDINNPVTIGDSQNFSYTYLLNRLFTHLHPNQNQNKNDNIIVSIPPPKVGIIGVRKTIFDNIYPICNVLNRDPNHFKKFIETELIIKTNFNGSKQLVLTGRWKPENIKTILKKYIYSYVLCENCSSLNTNMKRNKTTRLYDLKCNKCQSTRQCKRIEKAFRTIANRRDKIQQ
eukprot:1011917_1